MRVENTHPRNTFDSSSHGCLRELGKSSLAGEPWGAGLRDLCRGRTRASVSRAERLLHCIRLTHAHACHNTPNSCPYHTCTHTFTLPHAPTHHTHALTSHTSCTNTLQHLHISYTHEHAHTHTCACAQAHTDISHLWHEHPPKPPHTTHTCTHRHAPSTYTCTHAPPTCMHPHTPIHATLWPVGGARLC